uniref:Thioesterase domain-containing protein n=1 Tax=Alexandrium andersonii TaxID=327968 RepID=A0A7S2DZJ1_9DINO
MEGLQPMFKQHAKGAKLEGAPFVLMGHSIGVLIMLGVAERVKAVWGLEPSCIIVMDRGAPQHPLCSDFGARLLERDSLDFIRIFNPQVYGMYMQSKAKGGEDKENNTAWKMCNMWMEDIKYQQNTKLEGFHVFRCPVHVFVAMQNWSMDSEEAMAKLAPDVLAWHKERCAILGSKEHSQALWDFECYEDWKRWTTEGCELHKLDQDHALMKTDRRFARQLWDILKEYQCSVEVSKEA